MAALQEHVKGSIVIGMEVKPHTRKRTGRPLSFDREAALDRAMLLFWRQGYETTSISDLTAALGVSPPSIYTAFSDKRRLFLEAAHRYASGPRGPREMIAGAATARGAAWSLLEAAAVGFTGEETPPGCLLATAAITGSPQAADVREEIAGIRRGIEAALLERSERGAAAGEALPDVDSRGLAGLVMATIQGMSTLARDGAPRARLLLVAETAMRAWD